MGVVSRPVPRRGPARFRLLPVAVSRRPPYRPFLQTYARGSALVVLDARRAINCRAQARGLITERVIRNHSLTNS